MKKVIVTTTINPPTEAIEKFQELKDWELVVAGDLKTPKDYKLRRGVYIPPLLQEQYDPKLSETIGWNCIQRRNFGLLWAKDMGADIILQKLDNTMQTQYKDLILHSSLYSMFLIMKYKILWNARVKQHNKREHKIALNLNN